MNSRRSICLCLLSTGIKDTCQHTCLSRDQTWVFRLILFFMKEYFTSMGVCTLCKYSAIKSQKKVLSSLELKLQKVVTAMWLINSGPL